MEVTLHMQAQFFCSHEDEMELLEKETKCLKEFCHGQINHTNE